MQRGRPSECAWCYLESRVGRTAAEYASGGVRYDRPGVQRKGAPRGLTMAALHRHARLSGCAMTGKPAWRSLPSAVVFTSGLLARSSVGAQKWMAAVGPRTGVGAGDDGCTTPAHVRGRCLVWCFVACSETRYAPCGGREGT
jgi:hypothetical protein